MTRTQKSHDQIDSVGKNFIKKYPEFDLKKRKAGPVAINARRLIYEDGNHNLRTATPHYPFVHGALQGPNAWAVHQEGYIVRQGPTKLYAQSSLEIGPIKVAEDGRTLIESIGEKPADKFFTNPVEAVDLKVPPQDGQIRVQKAPGQ